MPRDGSGVYTLPAGNPVVTNTIIASAWANNTMSDIAAQLNNVFTRDGTLGPTGPFKIVDGTVNAPGLAWNSEPGLGWYRLSAGNISMAAGGGRMAGWDFSDAANSVYSMTPRAAGGSVVHLSNQPSGTANSNLLSIIQAGAAATIATAATGAAVRQSLTLDAPNVAHTGTLTAQGNISGSLGVYALGGLMGMFGDASARYASFTGGGACSWQWNTTNASVAWLNSSAVSKFSVDDSGNVTAAGIVVNVGGNGLALVDGASRFLRFSADNWRWEWASAGTVLSYVRPDNSALIQFDSVGGAFKLSAGNTWGNLSDVRAKTDIEDWHGGLEKVLSLRPRMFTRTDTGERAIGCIADEAEQGFGELVSRGPGKIGDTEYPDRATTHIDPLFWALVNAIKTLNDRIAQLENA